MKKYVFPITLISIFAITVGLLGVESSKLRDKVKVNEAEIEKMVCNLESLEKERSLLELEIRELEKELLALEGDNVKLKNKNNKLIKDNRELKSKPPTRGGVSRTKLGEFEATAYCKCTKCCGKWTNSPTKSGTTPLEGRTIAVDSNIIPLGSKVLVDGKEYVAEDTGSAIKGRIIDVYFKNHSDAIKFGRQKVQIEILK